MARTALTLTPLDTLFFRDGRPFDASDRASGSLPTPQPLVGALRTAILASEPGFHFGTFGREVKAGSDISEALRKAGLQSEWYEGLRFNGPFLAIQKDADRTPVPLLPTPLNLRRKSNGTWVKAEPREDIPEWKPELPHQLPLWQTDMDAEYPGGFLALPAIESYLNGDDVTDDDWFEHSDLCQTDFRTGIEVNPHTFTAQESKIYGVSLLALQTKIHRDWYAGNKWNGQRVVLYAEVHGQEVEATVLQSRVAGPIPLGGEGHYVNSISTSPVSWPQSENSNSKNRIWLLASPALLPHELNFPQWLPAGIPAENLVAANTGQAIPVSGWDGLKRGPRATRFAVPAGSVFYTKNLTHLHADSVCSESQPEDVQQGWGFALSGDWT